MNVNLKLSGLYSSLFVIRFSLIFQKKLVGGIIEKSPYFLFMIRMCHSPLPDWIAVAGELALGADMGAPQDSRKGILAINSNSN